MNPLIADWSFERGETTHDKLPENEEFDNDENFYLGIVSYRILATQQVAKDEPSSRPLKGRTRIKYEDRILAMQIVDSDMSLSASNSLTLSASQENNLLAIKRQFSHPNIVAIRGFVLIPHERSESRSPSLDQSHGRIQSISSYFQSKRTNQLGIITDCLPFPSLSEWIHDLKHRNVPVPINQKLRIAIQITDVLLFLHQRKVAIVHGFLSSSNVLIDENHLQVFLQDTYLHYFQSHATISNKAYNNQSFEMGNSVPFSSSVWSAPELLTRFQSNHRQMTYSTKVDSYGFGLIFWELIEERHFDEEVLSSLGEDYIDAIKEGWQPPVSNHIHSEIKDLIVSCLHVDPTKRPTFISIKRELLNLLQHLE